MRLLAPGKVYAIEWSARGRGGRVEFTSASANKYLRRLQDEKDRLLRTEQEVSTYVLADGEAAEPPVYDYGAVREKVAQIDRQARAIRHALHRFNMQTVLPERGITIDEALILLAQLSGRKDRLNELASRQSQERLGNRYFGSSSGPIEYRYANYDVAQAEADYRAVADEIAALQLELDLVNQTEVFSVEL